MLRLTQGTLINRKLKAMPTDHFETNKEELNTNQINGKDQEDTPSSVPSTVITDEVPSGSTASSSDP